MKTILLPFTLLILIAGLISFTFRPVYDPAFLERLTTQLTQYTQTLPQEKVYLHCDKPFYKPGDDLWFKAYLPDAQSHAASATSQIVYVELISPKGNVEKTLNLVAHNGHTAGDFHLDESAPGGTYKIRAYTQWMKNFGKASFFEKEIPVQTVLLPRLLMNLEFERKAYGSADLVSAKLTLANLENKPLAKFPFSFLVQLQGNEWTRGKGKTDADGLAYLTFQLPKKLEVNDGLLNVLFDYEGSTESISRSVPIVLNRLDFQFFPEGGDLVQNVESRVAFKALNEFGKPADVKGIVVDQAGKTITEFSSYHQGMGAFQLKPTENQSYRVQITQPAGIDQAFALPTVIAKGYTLSVQLVSKKSILRVRITSPIMQPTVLVAQVRGKIYFTKELKSTSEATTVDIPTQNFPIGIAQLTLFDYLEVPRCERLVFVNKHKQLQIEVSTNKAKYLPREKVEMTVCVRDEDGLPTPANLSLSVVDDKLISFADDKQDNILSYLLMSSDLKGKVEEPNFYFNPKEPRADQALDYLLMTQGWRRFEWKEVLQGSPDQWSKKLLHAPEKAVLHGKVLRLNNQQIISGAKVTVLETGESTTTDAEGKFSFLNLDLSTPRTLQATTDAGLSRMIQVNDYAQDYLIGGEITGQVRDDHQNPLPGVSIVVKGTTIGVATDFDGYYHLGIPERGKTLVFSYIGFLNEEVAIGEKRVIDIALRPDVVTLSEVVVGYGAQTNEVYERAAPQAPRRKMKKPEVLEAPPVIVYTTIMADEVMPPIEEVKVNGADVERQDKLVRFIAPQVIEASGEENALEKPIQRRFIESEAPSEQVYSMVEQMPEFEGGVNKLMTYLAGNIQYPINAARMCVEGTVFVGFVVNIDGGISDIHVVKGISQDCDQEAVRVISQMPKWIPGKQNRRAIPVRYTLPIRYKLEAYKKNNPDSLLIDLPLQTTTELPAKPAKYSRARTFYAPVYKPNEKVETRTDFRQTIYWNPNVEVGKTGETTLSFYNSDEITAFRATVEGIAPDGTIGHTTFAYFTQLPFSLDTKVPAILAFDDQISVPVTLKNNTHQPLQGSLNIIAPLSLKAMNAVPTSVKVAANSTTTVYLDYLVLAKAGKEQFSIRFESQGLSDAFEQPVEIKAKGFPVVASFSGNELDKTYALDIKDLVKNSLSARFTAYPDVLTDLMAGIESILQEPHGCFEQTSSSTYPNILALQYMRESGKGSAAIRAKATKLIEKGYQMLVPFETSEKGYEWFGSTPAHEGLTAYGLMEFADMQEVYASVEAPMVSRTAKWMLSRRDGKGGFRQHTAGYNEMGSASPEVTNAYIVYALSEAGFTDISKEMQAVHKKALQTKDVYQLALVANSLFNSKQPEKAQAVLSEIKQQMARDGVEKLKADHSITRSYGKSLQVETASLVALALLKEENVDLKPLQQIIRFLATSRENYGGFGSTQATILALKALTKYAQFAKQTASSGTIGIYMGTQKIASHSYQKGTNGEIVIEGLEKYLTEGKQQISVRFAHTQEALPYSMDIRWSTYTPHSQAACQVSLTTKLSKAPVRVGETLRLTTTLKNKTKEGLPMTVAVVGIPSGLSAQPWQLKELQDKKRVAFYEVRQNYLVFYYRSLAPSAAHTIILDLKAEIPGTYEAPASSAYLYYTSEFKNWAGGEKVIIGKSGAK